MTRTRTTTQCGVIVLPVRFDVAATIRARHVSAPFSRRPSPAEECRRARNEEARRNRFPPYSRRRTPRCRAIYIADANERGASESDAIVAAAERRFCREREGTTTAHCSRKRGRNACVERRHRGQTLMNRLHKNPELRTIDHSRMGMLPPELHAEPLCEIDRDHAP